MSSKLDKLQKRHHLIFVECDKAHKAWKRHSKIADSAIKRLMALQDKYDVVGREIAVERSIKDAKTSPIAKAACRLASKSNTRSRPRRPV